MCLSRSKLVEYISNSVRNINVYESRRGRSRGSRGSPSIWNIWNVYEFHMAHMEQPLDMFYSIAFERFEPGSIGIRLTSISIKYGIKEEFL